MYGISVKVKLDPARLETDSTLAKLTSKHNFSSLNSKHVWDCKITIALIIEIVSNAIKLLERK